MRSPTEPSARAGVETGGDADAAWRAYARSARARSARYALIRSLAWGAVVAFFVAVLAGILRTWVWVLVLEPIALGFVIGEATAEPSSVRHRRPSGWIHGLVLAEGVLAYTLVHVVYWLATQGFLPAQSFIDFLRAAPSATAVPFFRSVDLARELALVTGGTTALKYWIWGVEAVLMGAAAALAHLGGSFRRLKS